MYYKAIINKKQVIVRGARAELADQYTILGNATQDEYRAFLAHQATNDDVALATDFLAASDGDKNAAARLNKFYEGSK